MSLLYIAGFIGAGKTVYATKTAQLKLNKGIPVYTNFYCKGCYKFNVADLDIMCFEEKAFFIIDETGTEFNSRNFKNTSMLLIKYFKVSRHYVNSGMFVSQTFTDTDKQIRELCDKVRIMQPFSVMGKKFTMPVKVTGKLRPSVDGSITMQYKVGHIGIPTFMWHWYNYFDTLEKEPRELILRVGW
jgi:hypothetical protein